MIFYEVVSAFFAPLHVDPTPSGVKCLAVDIDIPLLSYSFDLHRKVVIDEKLCIHDLFQLVLRPAENECCGADITVKTTIAKIAQHLACALLVCSLVVNDIIGTQRIIHKVECTKQPPARYVGENTDRPRL